MYLSELGAEREGKSLQDIFDIEHERVKKNIKDLRTSAAEKRKIRIDLVYQTNDDRKDVVITYSIKTDLAMIQGGQTIIELLDNGMERISIMDNRMPGQVDYRDLEDVDHEEM